MTDLRKAAEMAIARALKNIRARPETREAPHQTQAIEALRQALAEPDDERIAALRTLDYCHGLKAGWNFCVANDDAGFERAIVSTSEAMRILKKQRALAQPVDAVNMSQERVDETAKREHEPVAWMWKDGSLTSDPDYADGTWTPLYTAPVDVVNISAERVDETVKGGHEPVAWHEPDAFGNVTTHKKWALENGWQPLYTAPPKRKWVGLTDDEIGKFADERLAYQIKNYRVSGVFDFAKAIEDRLKEKNGG